MGITVLSFSSSEHSPSEPHQHQQHQTHPNQQHQHQNYNKESPNPLEMPQSIPPSAVEIIEGVTIEKGNMTDKEHQEALVQKYLEIQDAAFKNERRSIRWGAYANATSRQDIIHVERKQRAEIAQKNEYLVSLAKRQGINLLPLDEYTETEDGKTVDIKILPKRLGHNWYHKVDQELEGEWDRLERGSDSTDGAFPTDLEPTNTVVLDKTVMSREMLRGFRINAPGSWSLDVTPGDYLVHRKYGIGRFQRICAVKKTKLSKAELAAQEQRRKTIIEEMRRNFPLNEAISELMSKFGTDDDLDPISNPQVVVLEVMLFRTMIQVPIDRAYRLSRYQGGNPKIPPKVSSLRRGGWRRITEKAKETTLVEAQDVLALYATRETLSRQPCDPALENEMRAFEESFEFEPTPDQKQCFEDVENDMIWRTRPMDRLVCGDVGFGKTEVAMRAVYRAVINGRQAAVLAPSTILASQHYDNFVKRMGEDSPFKKRILFLGGSLPMTTRAGVRQREAIRDGEYDVIVGTHTLLNKHIAYKNLGVLVVDEEQRFGVSQKEKLKVLHGLTDVLTLSATPIPRTLQMSMSGIRDTSNIRSPPPMRRPIKSTIREFDMDIVMTAIGNELARGGQCFYVVPMISMVEKAEAAIKKHFPNIRLVVAHSRSRRFGAELNVARFAQGEYDLLLATTVIENGVDIPNANTIIIQDSQRFGLSTLYQLRGRVGRSDTEAYAYFLYDGAEVTPKALMRLHTLEKHQELGAGFEIARRDLEIRGAGALLGTEQSGVAASVGFDLYMRMLKSSIRQLRGLDLPPVPRTNVLLPNQEGRLEMKEVCNDTTVSINLVKIPEDYIANATQRKMEETHARLAETSSSLVSLTQEWKEKYGPLPASLQGILKTLHLHACTRQLGIDLIGLSYKNVGRTECIFRSPGLRPRHMGLILPHLKNCTTPVGLDVIFPPRFTVSGVEQVLIGGESVDLGTLWMDPDHEEDADNWDVSDQEAVEAMKEISSAYTVTDLSEVDTETYPRFILRDFDGTAGADQLLKALLPVANVVNEIRTKYKRAAIIASSVRDKRAAHKRKVKGLRK